MQAVSFFKQLIKPTKKKIIISAILLITLFGGYFYYQSQQSSKDQIKTITVSRSDIKETVSSSGSMTGKRSANLRFAINGKLAYVNVQIGDTVTPNQLLAGLDLQALNINLQQAENNLKAAQADVDKTVDDIHLNQYGNGGFDQVGSAEETQTQRNIRTAAQVARDNAVDSVKAAKRAYQDAVLYSPIEGIVTSAVQVDGQNVTAADTIIQIVDDSEIYLDAEVDESDIGKVSINQKADITLNTYPDRTFTGTVTQILPTTKETSTGATVVVTRIRLDDQSIQFIANLNGQAEIITNQASQVITIPIESIFEDKYVWVKNGNDYQKVEVKTGISSDIDIEIVEGLSEGQEVVTTPSLVKQ